MGSIMSDCITECSGHRCVAQFSTPLHSTIVHNGFIIVTTKHHKNIYQQVKHSKTRYINRSIHKLNPALIRYTDNSLLKFWKHLKSHKPEKHFSQVNLITINKIQIQSIKKKK